MDDTIGGIFSVFDSTEGRRHREIVAAIQRLRRERAPESVVVLITDRDGNPIVWRSGG